MTAHLIEVAPSPDPTSPELELEVQVAAKERAADGVVALTLSPVRDVHLPAWEPGAHVDLRAAGVTPRQYSLCGDPSDLSTYRLGVLREAMGRGTSLFIHDQLSVGDLVTIRGPRNHFRFERARAYQFIAGGIGITPILPMVAQAAREGAKWHLAYGGRSRASMAFLEELARYGDRVTVYPQDECGLLDLDSLLDAPDQDTFVYCCGPEPLLEAVEERCVAWPSGLLHVERFQARPRESISDTPFEVFLSRTGVSLTVPPGRSILETVREAGVAVASSCQDGICGTCETGLLEGSADHRDSLLSEEERRESKTMMICVSRAKSPTLVLDL